MVLKEFTRMDLDILILLGEGRSEIRMQVLKFPGATAHRLKPTIHHRSQKNMPKDNK